LVASRAFFTAERFRERLKIQIRSPILLKREQSPPASRILVQSPVAAILASPPSRPIAVVSSGEAASAAPSSRRTRRIEVRSLAIQKINQSLPTLLSLRAVAFAFLCFDHFYARFLDIFWLTLLAITGFVIAGISVLGVENRARTYRFLVHHGARPGMIW